MILTAKMSLRKKQNHFQEKKMNYVNDIGLTELCAIWNAAAILISVPLFP